MMAIDLEEVQERILTTRFTYVNILLDFACFLRVDLLQNSKTNLAILLDSRFQILPSVG
jgi:hypothetical protein